MQEIASTLLGPARRRWRCLGLRTAKSRQAWSIDFIYIGSNNNIIIIVIVVGLFMFLCGELGTGPYWILCSTQITCPPR